MELKTLNYFSCFPAHNLEYLDPVFLKLSWCPKYQKRVQLNPEMALRIRVRPCLKANHGVRDFGLLFICPSLDYSVSPKPPYCFKYPRTDIISTSDSLVLGLKLHFICVLTYDLWYFDLVSPNCANVPNALKQVWLNSTSLAFTLE